MTKTKRFPSFRFHKPSGKAVVTINGRDIYLGNHPWKTDPNADPEDCSFESRRKYEAMRVKFLLSDGEAEEPVSMEDSELLVAELCAAFLGHAKQKYIRPRDGKPSSELAAFRRVLSVVRRLFGGLRVSEFRRRELKAVLDGLAKGVKQKGRKTVRKPSRKTIASYQYRICKVFKYAADELEVDPAVYHRLAVVAKPEQFSSGLPELDRIQAVDEAIALKTCEALPTLIADMVRLQLFTGMRPGEVCMMKPGDVDRSSADWLYMPRHHKLEKKGIDRVIVISPRVHEDAQAILAKYLLRPADRYCFRPKEASSDPRIKSEYFEVEKYRQAIHRACDALEIPRWNPNQLRHAFAEKAQRKWGLQVASIFMGHTSEKMTKTYAKQNVGLALDLIAKSVG